MLSLTTLSVAIFVDMLFGRRLVSFSKALAKPVVEVTDKGVWTEDKSGERKFPEADSVIMATGLKPNEVLKDSFKNVALEVIAVGDFYKVGNILVASSAGYYASLRI